MVQDADAYLRASAPFRLGALPTERSHPLTRGLGEASARDAVRMIQAVDATLPDALARAMATPAYAALVAALRAAFCNGGRVFCVGCGATGRLAILLEAAWRRGCADDPAAAHLHDRVWSVMAGGDFALIRSVEGFEDFTAFGRHQLLQAGPPGAPGPRSGDVVLAVTEGGETPFVLGAAEAGADAGAHVTLVFNNPVAVLRETVQRSRRLIDDPRVDVLDLSAGPMAVAGSTRMQATSSELLAVGGALEQALSLALGRLDISDLAADTRRRLHRFTETLATISTPNAVDALAAAADAEAALYRRGLPVTYAADMLLLDVLTDTTERSPTFSLPPFRPDGDTSTPPPWAFVQRPGGTAAEAWTALLARPVRGLDWGADDYRRMGAPAMPAVDPPALDRAAVHRFGIGGPPAADRLHGAGVAVGCADDDADALARFTRGFAHRGRIALVPTGTPLMPADGFACDIAIDLHPSPLRLHRHLSIKLVLNTLSTVTMARMGRLSGNWMVHVRCSNMKLIDRGVRLLQDRLGLDYEAAARVLFHSIEVLRADPALAASTSPVAHALAEAARGRRGG